MAAKRAEQRWLNRRKRRHLWRRVVETRTPGPTSGDDTVTITLYNDQLNTAWKSVPFEVTDGSSWLEPNGATDIDGHTPDDSVLTSPKEKCIFCPLSQKLNLRYQAISEPGGMGIVTGKTWLLALDEASSQRNTIDRRACNILYRVYNVLCLIRRKSVPTRPDKREPCAYASPNHGEPRYISRHRVCKSDDSGNGDRGGSSPNHTSGSLETL